MSALTSDHRDLLHALAHLYLRHGQSQRALVLALLAARTAPGDAGLERTLAYALVANGAGREAMSVIDKLEAEAAQAGEAPAPTLRLLRSHALFLAGRRDEARSCFGDYVASRQQGA